MNTNNFRAFLETERIFFTPFDAGVIDDYFMWVNDRGIIKHLETGRFPKTKEQLIAYIQSINNDPNQVIFAVFDKETRSYIGNAKLGEIDWINRTAKYGRMIGNVDMQKKGYGTDMAYLLLHYAFKILNLNKVCAGVEEGNVASINSNKKVGLEVEGVLYQQVFNNGEYKNIVMMGIVKDKFLSNYPIK